MKSKITFCTKIFLLILIALSNIVGSQAQTPVNASYQGAVGWYIADLKTSFPGSEFYSNQTALTETNYELVLEGLKNNGKVNGVRLPIFPEQLHPDAYSELYKHVYSYARHIGLIVYASPRSVGMDVYAHWSPQQYARWLADYANYYQPEFMSPFNEAGLSADKIAAIVSQLRPLLRTTHTRIVGPDRQHVESTIHALNEKPGLIDLFDVISSHNANNDVTATRENWMQLVAMVGNRRPVWASEDPRPWNRNSQQQPPGIADAVGGGVQGVVIWMAKPGLIDNTGRITAKARDIAANLVHQ